MSWMENDKMSEKYRFVLACEQPGVNVTALCEEFNIARSTGSKWLRRYREQGLRGLEEQSRRPKSCSLAISAETVCEISKLSEPPKRLKAKRITAILRRQLSPEESPSLSTVHRVLQRLGRVDTRRRRRKNSAKPHGAVCGEQCNDSWTTDFKGWWRTRDGKRCEPLTIRDNASRYLLDLFGFLQIATEAAKDRFRWCFELYGMPLTIWSDNGAPFASSTGLLGLSKLSVWFIKLGIEPKRIPKSSPWCNGGHERMHGDIARDLESNPERDCPSQQAAFNLWRVEFNDTPHGALDNRTPAEVYARSRRRYDSRELEYEYSKNFHVRKVDVSGFLFFNNERLYLSKAFAGEHVALEQVDELTLQLWFCNFPLGSAFVPQASRKHGKNPHRAQHFSWIK